MSTCTVYHPFHIAFAVKSTRDAVTADRVVHAGELHRVIAAGQTPAFRGIVSTKVTPKHVEIEAVCDRDKPAEKSYGALMAELEKLGWERAGI